LLSGGALASALAVGAASAGVPARLLEETVRAAMRVAAGQAAGVATPAAVLMNEVLRAMLMTKLKVYLAVGLVAVMFGAGGLAFRAAGQAPAPGEQRTAARPPTDLDLLRREVEVLKLQVELLQDKQRAQEAELRSLRGHGGTALPAGEVPGVHAPTKTPPAGDMRPVLPPETQSIPYYYGTYVPSVREATPPVTSYGAPGGLHVTRISPEQQLEAAVKALRENPDDEQARRRAVQALERALQQLKQKDPTDGQQAK